MSLPISRRMDFSEIPVIDMHLLCQGKDDPETIEKLYKACADVGFLYVKNHGVEKSLVDDLLCQAKLFFTQAESEKQKIKIDQSIRGYLPLFYRSYEGEERAGTSHQEGFWIGHETEIDSTRPLDGSNQWPEHPKELKQVMQKYFVAVEKLSCVLHRAFALALNLQSDTFLNMFQNPNSRLKLNHYPPQNNPVSENNIGVVPHSDSGGFTILWQDHHGGLEIQNKSGDWVGAPPIDDTFVVNLGNIMQIWSNGQFSSTPHRVINRGGNDRYSIPLFVNPDSNVEIKPLMNVNTNCEAFNYGEYQVELWRRTFPIANIP